MKIRTICQVTTVGLAYSLSLLANSANAAVSNSELDAQIQKITAETQALQQEVQSLRAEVKQLRKQKAQLQQSKQAAPVQVVAAPAPQTARPVLSPAAGSGEDNAAPAISPSLQGQRFTQGVTVTTSPLLGIRSAYDASDLVVNYSTMNEDLRLLLQREQIDQQLRDQGLSTLALDRPLIELGAIVESQGILQEPYEGATNSTINLSRARLDILGYVSTWVTGFITMQYDDSPLPDNVQGSGQVEANSRIFLNRGFLTIGNLERFPVYFSAGQMYAPFGDYSTQFLDNTLPQSIGQANDRLAILGLYRKGFYGQLYAFSGDTTTSSNDNIDNGGINIGYKNSTETMTSDIGMGYMSNIADSLGMQSTGAPSDAFQGFGYSSATEVIDQRVPAVDFHLKLNKGAYTLIGELITTTRSFAAENLSYNNKGAQPSALHIEGDRDFMMFNKPSVFTLAYDQSWQALALNLPQYSYVAELNTSIWKNTIETLEYRHDINYPTSDTAGGNGFAPLPSVGSTQNTLTAQIGVYF